MFLLGLFRILQMKLSSISKWFYFLLDSVFSTLTLSLSLSFSCEATNGTAFFWLYFMAFYWVTCAVSVQNCYQMCVCLLFVFVAVRLIFLKFFCGFLIFLIFLFLWPRAPNFCCWWYAQNIVYLFQYFLLVSILHLAMWCPVYPPCWSISIR